MNTVYAFSALQFVSVCYTPYARIPYGHLYREYSDAGMREVFFCNTAEAARAAELKGWRFIRRPDPELSPPRLADQRAGDTRSDYSPGVISQMEAARVEGAGYRARKRLLRDTTTVEHEVQEQLLTEDSNADVD